MTRVLNKGTCLAKGMQSKSKFLSNISICTWNVGGLFPANLNKITDANLLEEIIGHDIILLTETHLGKDENIVLSGYKYYPVCRPISANNRYFGGLVIFIKVTILPGIEIMKNTNLDSQWVKLDKLFFNLSKHIFLCPTYIIPASSSYIFQSDVDVLDRIDKYIVNQYAEKGHSVLYGDFNARTGSELDYIESDIFDPYTIDEKEYEYDILLQKRKGCDNKVDGRGKQLLQMCISLKLRILNGRILGDSNDNFTCFKYNGTNVVDYIIMSEDLIKQILNCKASNVIPCLSDCHCKVSVMLLSLYRNNNENTIHFPGKFKWAECSKENIQDAICHPSCKHDIKKYLSKHYDAPLNVDTAAADFQNIVLKAAKLSLIFKSTKFKKYKHLKKKWYDQDLCNKKKELYIEARHMSANPFNIIIRNNYFKNYREFKQIKKIKERNLKKTLLNNLIIC